jgi:hypothetical protein
MVLGLLAGAADAQVFTPGVRVPIATNTTPLRVYFTRLYCHDVSDDNTWPRSDRDEPYVVVFAADLRGGNALGRVFVSQEFSDVDTGSTRTDLMPIWGLDGNGAPINSYQDTIFLVALMECDETSNRGAIKRKLSSVLLPKLASYKAAGMPYSSIVGNLRIDMSLALDQARATYQDEDDRVGGLTEVFFSAPGQLERARAGQAVELTREFRGSDSRYTLTFRLQ